jgi:hypothetical protein
MKAESTGRSYQSVNGRPASFRFSMVLGSKNLYGSQSFAVFTVKLTQYLFCAEVLTAAKQNKKIMPYLNREKGMLIISTAILRIKDKTWRSHQHISTLFPYSPACDSQAGISPDIPEQFKSASDVGAALAVALMIGA